MLLILTLILTLIFYTIFNLKCVFNVWTIFVCQQFVEEKLSRKILEQARKQQDELEAEFGVASSSNKSLKTAQTRLGPPELQNLDADELESDEDDAASVASEQFYENIVSYSSSCWSFELISV